MKKTGRGARYIAIDILCSWEENRLPVDQIMEEHLAKTDLEDPRDRQLIMSLIYGVLRWQGYLDWVTEKFSKYPLTKIKSRILQALRIGIYQLLFLDRIPASAAINETVQALKDMKQPKWLTGFVNGVLRNVNRAQQGLPVPLSQANNTSLPDRAKLSHPDWLVERWKERYGYSETVKICQANNTQAPVCLRINTMLTTSSDLIEKFRAHDLDAASGQCSPLAVKLNDYHGPVTAIPGFQDGLFQVQDEAAQLITLLLGPLSPDKYYLDGCAGLGGKASHLAQMLPAKSTLIAVEPNSGRVLKLKENLERLRLDKTVTIVESTLDSLLPDNREKFTGILIDAPCSGLGVIRRHPDIRWNRHPDDLLRYQEKQLALLNAAARLLAPEGILVYATCSTEPEENEEAVKNFLITNPQFVLTDCRNMLPGGCTLLVDKQGFFRTLPGQEDLDGFFAARLKKMKN
jgi:16S rRNA (cytosine967-C5)-methyltransferase